MPVTKLPRNLFGTNLALNDLERAVAALGLEPGDKVLDLGGAANPLPRADVVCDLSFASSTQRNGAPTTLREGVRYVEAAAEELPFEDGEFDFLWCTQVLEHVRDPHRAVSEILRVAKRGFIEVPSRMGELLNGNPSHRWIIDREGDELVFHARQFVEHPLGNFLYAPILANEEFRARVEVDYRNLFNIQILFDSSLSCRVEGKGDGFDYDDPDQAARAHYSFARNILNWGGDPSYVYPDAVEALRLRPNSSAARRLLAVCLARLERLADAEQLLAEGGESPELQALAQLVSGLSDQGEPTGLPLPEAALGDEDPEHSPSTRPQVSVIVVARDPDELRASVESALTQDYPAVDVVAAAPLSEAELESALAGLEMPERLTRLALGAGASEGHCLNQGALRSRGSHIAFLRGGERFASHHVDRLVAQLNASGADAVHSDRIILESGAVAGPEIRPGHPATASASLSTLLAPRETLASLGPCNEELREGVGIDYLVRLARRFRLEHLPEVSVEAARAPKSTDGLLSLAGLPAHRIPMELGRSLMAAHQRELDLRARVAALEAQLADLRAGGEKDS